MISFWQALFFGIGIIATGCFVMLLLFYQRREREQLARQARAEADMQDVMALFQTMRDILSQQKNLAREFNQDIEKKMQAVKTVLSQGLERNERLYEQQQSLQQQLEETRAQLESIQRQAGYLAPPAPAPAPAQAQRRTAPAREPLSEPARTARPANAEGGQHQSAAVFRKLAEELEQDSGGLPGALDLTEAGSLENPWDNDDFEMEQAPPESPKDPGTARAAFRALLDLGPDAAEADGGNGQASMTPVQKRVLEYHDAGMSVADISRELGLGKGEVRLMLSLARQK